MFEPASPTGKSFRFVRVWRDATRDHYTLGRFVPRTVLPPPSSSPPPPRSCSRVLSFVLAFGFSLLASLFCSFLLFLLRACALGFCLGFWLPCSSCSCALVRLAFGFCLGFCLGFRLLAFARLAFSSLHV